MRTPRKATNTTVPAPKRRLQVFVERIALDAINIDIYAVADEGAPESARYLLYHQGVCVNASEPFWRLPSRQQIQAFLAGEDTPAPRRERARAARPRHPRRAHASLHGTHRRAAH